MNTLENIKLRLRELDGQQKKNLIKVCISYFVVLFTYPFLRATTTALYIQTFGAKATPVVWFLSVFVLSIVVFFYNRIQKKMGVHELFTLTSAISIMIFLVSLWGVNYGIKEMGYLLYIWKEIYIVLLIGMVLGYSNNFLTIDQAKVCFGFIGGSGSIGGILGGILTSVISRKWGFETAIVMACGFLAINAAIFFFTDRLVKEKRKEPLKDSPIAALKGAGKYVACIAAMVALSQFCINIANLEFNLIFEKIVPDVNEKAGYLGFFFAAVNAITLIFQAIVIPIVLSKFKLKNVHFFIPGFYFVVIFLGLGLGSQLLWCVAGTFIILKGVDYSIFSVAKDILLYPLTPIQKYGAKYINDMIVYRLAKALISAFLIYFQSLMMLNVVMGISLFLWVLVIFKLYTYQKKLKETN